MSFPPIKLVTYEDADTLMDRWQGIFVLGRQLDAFFQASSTEVGENIVWFFYTPKLIVFGVS